MNVIVSVQPPRALLLPLRQLGCSHVVGGCLQLGTPAGTFRSHRRFVFQLADALPDQSPAKTSKVSSTKPGQQPGQPPQEDRKSVV